MSASPGSHSFQLADLSLTTCVVVEDQKEILHLICDTLRTLRVGHVLPVSSHEQLVDLISRLETNPISVGVSNVDFAIIDWNLTGNAFNTLQDNTAEGVEVDDEASHHFEGSHVSKWFRHNEFTRFIPLMGISAYASSKIVAEMRNSGVNSFVSKPFTFAEISRHIQRIVQDIKPHIITPSGYFGPDRRRITKPISDERRRSQGGVKSFTPPRTLRNKTSNFVQIKETDVAKIREQMQEIAPPDFIATVLTNVEGIQSILSQISRGLETYEEKEAAMKLYGTIDYMCNDILSHAGCFSYQMLAEAFSGISRFIGDNHFMPTDKAYSLIKQQVATAELIARQDMRGLTTAEMRNLFSASLMAMEKLLLRNRNEQL